ncbi:recombinase family protein [Streptomyces sp. NPDC048650]|uniref:recombinase family protein n=1 Tax=unclassified Streptomyces TaxID=2593676 RepID=UPI003718FFCC
MTVYGYARTDSTQMDEQADELLASGCTHVFSDLRTCGDAPGSGWRELVDTAQAGDTVRVVSWTRLAHSAETALLIQASLTSLGVHVETIKR